MSQLENVGKLRCKRGRLLTPYDLKGLGRSGILELHLALKGCKKKKPMVVEVCRPQVEQTTALQVQGVCKVSY